MDAHPHHDLIMSSRVTGTPVFNRAGDRIGHIDDLSVNKGSGQVAYAIISFGGFLGVGKQMHPVPWSVLDYDTSKGGYVVPMDKAELEKAPSLGPEELEKLGAGDVAWRDSMLAYYTPFGMTPF